MSSGVVEQVSEFRTESYLHDFYSKYTPKETLGVGLSSVVRKCFNKETNKEFAVKIIDKNNDMESGIRNEVKLLSRLSDCPYIINLVDFFETETSFFLVFDLAIGGELFDYLTKSVTVNEIQARLFVYKILLAIKFMHDKNIVHRDVKPENILLDVNNEILLSDFGFSVELLPEETLKEVCGTPDYLAPEVLRCSIDADHPGYGKPVDLWATGVILFIMLVGFSPFWHRRQTVMLWNIMDGKYNMDTPEWVGISEAPKDLIKKLLVLNPNKRLTVDEALSHVWFERVNKDHIIRKRFKFKTVVLAIISIKYVLKTHISKQNIFALDDLLNNPYKSNTIRHLMDSSAFHIYEHWIKRSNTQNQDRAALFETKLKNDLCADHCAYVSFQYRLNHEHFFNK